MKAVSWVDDRHESFDVDCSGFAGNDIYCGGFRSYVSVNEAGCGDGDETLSISLFGKSRGVLAREMAPNAVKRWYKR